MVYNYYVTLPMICVMGVVIIRKHRVHAVWWLSNNIMLERFVIEAKRKQDFNSQIFSFLAHIKLHLHVKIGKILLTLLVWTAFRGSPPSRDL